MFFKRLQRQTFSIILILIFLLAWFIQSNLLMNVDVSWLLEATKRMLSGGTYTHNFFENNPPWILYFNIPLILFSKIFSVNSFLSLKIYVFLLSAISINICYFFLKQIFSKEDISLARFLLVVIAILFLILPTVDFGQREHLLFILTLPYLLMMTLRVKRRSIPPYLAIIIGLMAGSAFMFKPYFFMTLCLIETYYFINKKNLLSLCRPEIFSIIFLLLVYALLIFIRHMDYLKIVMPIALRWCYLGTKKPWGLVLSNIFAILCFSTALLYLALYEINRYPELTKILFLSLIGFLFSYIIQQEDWYYHLFPAFSTAILIYALFFGLYATTSHKKNYITFLVISFIAVILFFLNPFIYVLNYYLVLNPLVFFLFITSLLVSILYLIFPQISYRSKTVPQIFIFSLLISCFSYVLITHVMKWNGLQIYLIGLISLFFLCLLIPGSYNDKINYLLISFLGVLIFLLPFYQTFVSYRVNHKRKITYEKLITYINQNASEQVITFFSTNIADAYPIIPYTENATSGSRFSFFWALPGLIKQSYLPMNKQLYDRQMKDKSFLIDMVAEDLIIHKPKFVFIDTLKKKNSLTWVGNKLINIPFNYLDYFSGNHSFNQAWQNYHLFTTVSDYITTKINPFRYEVQLLYCQNPKDIAIYSGYLYLYLQDNVLKVALKDDYNRVKRIQMHVKDNTDKHLFLKLKKILLNPGAKLTGKNKEDFYVWISKQSLNYPLYKFDIYERK